MNTVDLTSYHPGYDEHCERTKVPFEDYRNLEDKLEIYEKMVNELEDIFESKYEAHGKLELITVLVKETKKELERC